MERSLDRRDGSFDKNIMIHGDSQSTNEKRHVSRTGDMLDEIQRKIYGQRVEHLTPVEINELFQLSVDPIFNLIIYYGLKRNAIDPGVTILQAIPRARSGEYLISIALCLRFGADANMYVNSPKLGVVHILGYVYNILVPKPRTKSTNASEKNILNTIILMLMVEGSLPSMPIFDREAGKIRDKGEMFSSSMTVLEWLNNQGYDTILNRISVGEAGELQKVVDRESIAILSILLDKVHVMSREYEPKDMMMAIRSFSSVSIDKIPVPMIKSGLDYKSLDNCVTYLNSEAYNKLLNHGQFPSYVLINKILVLTREYRASERAVAVNELENMLLDSVSVGIQLDRDQLGLISAMDSDILDAVMKEYEEPYWRKICKSNNPHGQIPDRLKKLAISLNIDPTLSQTAICDNISILSAADKELLKVAAKRRQQIRMAGELGTMNEFLGDDIPNLACRNRGLLTHDPFDYNDIDIAYYRDEQGAVWCFTSDTFSSLLETGVNPYNSVKLSDSFKEKIKCQIDILKHLGIDAEHGEIGIYSTRAPILFSTAIDSLTDKDVIDETESERYVNLFIQLASSNNISAATIRSLSKNQMTNALRSINYEVDLSSLSTSHAFVTVARIIVNLNKKDPSSTKLFFNSLSTK